MLAKVRRLASDGCAAERKMLFLCVQMICPNTVVVLRDYAHAARIAVKRPVNFDRALGADSQADQLREAFQCFDLYRLSRGRLDRPSQAGADGGDRQIRRSCIDGLRSLASAMRIDTDRALQEYLDVAPVVCEVEHAERLDDGDNRRAGSRLLGASFMSARFANRIEHVELLPTLVAMYNSILDGECQVERDLGRALSESKEHKSCE